MLTEQFCKIYAKWLSLTCKPLKEVSEFYASGTLFVIEKNQAYQITRVKLGGDVYLDGSISESRHTTFYYNKHYQVLLLREYGKSWWVI